MATSVIDVQVDAYNRRDLEAFLACYAPEVTVRNGRSEIMMSGLDALRKHYGEWFRQHPDLRVEVRGRLELPTWVVDAEHVIVVDAPG